MAARSIASLTISFGLVSIPVKLYTATESERGDLLQLLHKSCGSRLKQQYLCVKEEIPVAREDMVKGYEFAKDQYVMFTPEEMKALEEAGTTARTSPSSCRSSRSIRCTSTRPTISRPIRAAPNPMRC
jgi:DNA end-binding protein Ku